MVSSDSVTPYTLLKTHGTNVQNDKAEHTEEKNSYNWPASNDDKLFKVMNCALTTTMPSSETLCKAVKTDVFTTLSKRRHEEIENGAGAWLTSATDDIFMTSSTEMQGMNLFSVPPFTIALRNVILILPPPLSPPFLFGILCSQLDCVEPLMSIMSPDARGSFNGATGGGAGDVEGGTDLCFIRKSLFAPSDKEAMLGFGPRKRSSSLW